MNGIAGETARQINGKSAFVSEDALHFDGDKPNSVARSLERMIIYLSSLA